MLRQPLVAETVDVICHAVGDVVQRLGDGAGCGDIRDWRGVGAPGVAGYVEDCESVNIGLWMGVEGGLPLAQTRKRKVKA